MPRHAYGLDISDRSAELVSLFQKRGSVAIGGFGRTEIPPGIINRGVILDPDKLVAVLSRFFDAVFGPKRGRLQLGVALPESVVFSKTFPLPANFDRELAMKALTIEAADAFPIAMAETVSDIWVTTRTKESQDVMYAAADRHIAEAYRDVLFRANAQALFFDSESMALARAVADPVDNQPVMIVDIGAKTTMIVLYDLKSVQLSSNIAIGGDNLASALEVQLNLPLEKAELLKRKAGFDPSLGQGRPFLIMQRPMGEIIEEINLTMQFYRRRTGRNVHKIHLAGGTSLTPLIAEYIGSNFSGVEVMNGNPLRRISLEWLSDPDVFSKRSILYATAIGLAERALGAEAGPGIDLLPGAQERRGSAAGFLARFGSISSLFSSMVTRPKKPGKKKGHRTEEEQVTEEAHEEKAEAPEEASPAAVPAEAAAAAAAPVAAQPADKADNFDILAGLEGEPAKPAVPAESAAPVAAAASSAPNESPEALDFGRGIGDFLGTTYEGKEATDAQVAEDRPESATGGSRIKIDHILKRAKGQEEPEEVEEEVYTAASDNPGSSRLLVIGLSLLVILLVLAAAGGVYMFAKKNGMPQLAWPFGKTAAPPTNEATNEPAAGTATAPESVSVGFMAVVIDQPAGDKPQVATRVIETDVVASDTFTSTGTSVTASGRAKGTITIVNTTNQTYTFVATTRFLSPEGVLFRMDKSTNIPANGSVDTAVTADQPGPSGDVGPTRWTIPGLGQQDDIYGRSDAAMTGGSGSVKSVTQADLDAAKAALTAKLKAEAEQNFKAMLTDGEKLLEDLITSNELSVEAPKAGAAAGTFTMKLSLRYRAMLIPEPAVVTLLDARLTSQLPAGDTAADYELGAPQYTVEAYDTANYKAELRAEASVKKL